MAQALRIAAAALGVAGAAFTTFFTAVLAGLASMDAGGPGGLEGFAVASLPWAALGCSVIGAYLVFRVPRAAPWLLLAGAASGAIPLVLLGVKVGAYLGVAATALAGGLATRK